MAGAGLTFFTSLLLNLMLSGSADTWIVDGRALILNGQRTIHGWLDLLHGATLMALAGVAVAVLIWTVSYARFRPPPAPPSAAPTP